MPRDPRPHRAAEARRSCGTIAASVARGDCGLAAKNGRHPSRQYRQGDSRFERDRRARKRQAPTPPRSRNRSVNHRSPSPSPRDRHRSVSVIAMRSWEMAASANATVRELRRVAGTANTSCPPREVRGPSLHTDLAALPGPHRFATGHDVTGVALPGNAMPGAPASRLARRPELATPQKFQSGWQPQDHAPVERPERHTSIATTVQEHSAGRETTNNGQCPHRNLQSDLGMI